MNNKVTTEEERIKTYEETREEVALELGYDSYEELIHHNSHIADMDRFFKEVTERMLRRCHKRHNRKINDLIETYGRYA